MKAEHGATPVLVVLINNETDWRRVGDEGWYRIPLRHAPRPVAASYLAFYQSRAFGPDAFRVRYYAPVLRYRILTRVELLPLEPNHPRAQERYYHIALGPVQELEAPIPSRRLRRITFIPTTLRRLHEAHEINDLWLGDNVEDLVSELFQDAAVKATRRLKLGEAAKSYGVDAKPNKTPALNDSAGVGGSETRPDGVLSSHIEAKDCLSKACARR
jgi:hypothetical protein